MFEDKNVFYKQKNQNKSNLNKKNRKKRKNKENINVQTYYKTIA